MLLQKKGGCDLLQLCKKERFGDLICAEAYLICRFWNCYFTFAATVLPRLVLVAAWLHDPVVPPPEIQTDFWLFSWEIFALAL
jgi:hypothetical protein